MICVEPWTRLTWGLAVPGSLAQNLYSILACNILKEGSGRQEWTEMRSITLERDTKQN